MALPAAMPVIRPLKGGGWCRVGAELIEVALRNGRLSKFSEDFRLPSMNELVFAVTQEDDGGFVAECLQEPIFTQGDTWDELCDAVRDAVSGWHFDRSVPAKIRLHLVRDELLAVA